MMKIKSRLLTAIVVLVVIFAGGCTGISPPVTFYTLGLDASITQPDLAETSCSDAGIGVGLISWPRYLDQPRIVTRTGPNTLGFDEFHRWGGSLQDDFKRVLINNLSGLLQTVKVADSRKARRFKPDFTVEIDIRQFDGQLGKEIILDAGWTLISRQKDIAPGLYESRISKQMSGAGYQALASASSDVVADLSREIAAELLKACAANSQ